MEQVNPREDADFEVGRLSFCCAFFKTHDGNNNPVERRPFAWWLSLSRAECFGINLQLPRVVCLFVFFPVKSWHVHMSRSKVP